MLQIVPAIAPHVQGALWVSTDGFAFPYLIVQAFARQARRHGEDIREQSPVAMRRITPASSGPVHRWQFILRLWLFIQRLSAGTGIGSVPGRADRRQCSESAASSPVACAFFRIAAKTTGLAVFLLCFIPADSGHAEQHYFAVARRCQHKWSSSPCM